jgi:hypothetical protein
VLGEGDFLEGGWPDYTSLQFPNIYSSLKMLDDDSEAKIFGILPTLPQVNRF